MPLSLRWVLAYVIVAILWISVMQWLLQSIGGSQWSISTGGLIVGGIFVLITAWLLFFLLERGHAGRVSIRGAQGLSVGRARIWWVAMGVLIGATLLVQLFMVSFATREYRPVLLKQAHAELIAQVRLQAKSITDWLNQRNAMVSRLAAQTDLLSERLQAAQKNPAQALSELRQLVSEKRFVTITLYNADHIQKVQFGLKTAPKAPDPLFEQAAALSKVQFSCRFETGRPTVDCYWVLPIFLGHQEVSAGPWYLVFYGGLDAAALPGRDTLESSQPARSLLVMTPDDAQSRRWLGLSLHAAQGAEPTAAVRSVDPTMLTCIEQAIPLRDLLLHDDVEALRSAGSQSPAMRVMSGQSDCAPRSVLYASMVVPELHSVLWGANTEAAILQPIRKTRQLLAVAALFGVMALLLALFFFWQITRLHHNKALSALVRERDQLGEFWEQMPTVGLALVDPTSWAVLDVNRRWAQIFHAGRETLLTQGLLDVIQPAAGFSGLNEIRANDQQTLQDLCSGIREEVVLTRRIRTNDPAGEWVRVSMRVLKSTDQKILGVLVALDSLGETVDITHQTQAERDFYRLAWALVRTEHATPKSVDAASAPDASSLDEPPDRFAVLSTRIVNETGILALCLYTHWPEVWSTPSDLTGPQIEQHEQKHFQCHGGTESIRDVANQMAATGLIDRVLVAQTPVFIDDDVKLSSLSAGATLQSELCDQLRPYPVGAFAMIPVSARPGETDCVRAWIVFAGEGMRFTPPVRTALMALLAVATETLTPAD